MNKFTQLLAYGPPEFNKPPSTIYIWGDDDRIQELDLSSYRNNSQNLFAKVQELGRANRIINVARKTDEVSLGVHADHADLVKGLKNFKETFGNKKVNVAVLTEDEYRKQVELILEILLKIVQEEKKPSKDEHQLGTVSSALEVVETGSVTRSSAKVSSASYLFAKKMGELLSELIEKWDEEREEEERLQKSAEKTDRIKHEEIQKATLKKEIVSEEVVRQTQKKL